MKKILIIEDDSTMLRALKDNFEFAGYNVETAANGEDGLCLALDSKPDLIILDIMLPKINGYEICSRVRKAQLKMPIIMLTAKSQENDICLGLNTGADDYVTKPFSIKELLARVNAFLRRQQIDQVNTYNFGNCTLNTASRLLTKDKCTIDLSPREYNLLCYMIENAGRAVDRNAILDHVWGFGVFVSARTVDRFINTLRKKIEDNPKHPRFINTIREFGYKFEMNPDKSDY